MPATRPRVAFDHVSKRFRIHHERPRSFQDLLVRGLRRGASEEFWALKDVSFVAEPGMSLGIIGSNGSGKSTLLKLATRILYPTSGRITVDGRVSALLELGAGFHPDLSGRDNVFLNASILGMRRAEVAARFDSIVQFSGLERFIDIPVKHYSSGMYARLGFAVAINVDPDVLLIDEVLSVGDESFQERCLDAIQRFHREGKTLILISHDHGSITSICNEAIWLDSGVIRAAGAPRSVVAEYLAAAHLESVAQMNASVSETVVNEDETERKSRWGSGEARIVQVAFLDRDGREVKAVPCGEQLTIRIRYRAEERIEQPVFGLAFGTVDGVLVSGPNTQAAGLDIGSIEGEGEVTYRVEELQLIPGPYLISASIYDRTCTHPYDYLDQRVHLTVTRGARPERHGLVWLPAHWAHQGACGEQDE